ncbi:MAG TPA: DUF47 family protein [Verrucomicrobiales bacterium]|jgi:hypothetical protein|nr:DUF47 family protein [Verrucomicrobiales bacterium]
MISLQKLFGKDDKFFTLLEASAEEGRTSITALNKVLSTPDATPSLDAFHKAKETDKKITDQINEALVNSMVTQLEKEDIEVLSHSLYRIPKTVEKFAERFIISAALVKDVDFARHIALLDAATHQVVALVGMLRTLGAGKIHEAKGLNAKLQQIEGDADSLQLEMLRDLYSGRHEPIRVIALRDLFELLETVVDRCRDAGNIITHIVLKNS